MHAALRFASALSLAAALAAPALAAEDVPAAADAPPPGEGYHAPVSTEIVVTAPYARDRRDILSSVSVLAGDELAQAVRPTIGETLARTPGVTASSFGPAASRPILRGLEGERVRVLTDGIGSIDVSNTSVDHAVVINPLLADRVEVLRGPEALLYGSSAVGGVVNVLDKRIPRSVPSEAFHVDAIGTYGSAAIERSGAGAIDVPLGRQFVFHVDGSYTKTDDLRVGGYVLSPSARAQALASSRLPAADQVDADGQPLDFAAVAGLRGTLPNSASKTWTAGAGAAYIGDDVNFGLSYSHYDSLYGVPIRFALVPGAGQEAPRLQLAQDRVDGRFELKTAGGLLDAVRIRAGYADYHHFELESDGSIGTAFYNKGFEGRLELAQSQRGAWKGATGVQYFSRHFNVVGDEAFLPRNNTGQIGLFTLQELDFGALRFEGGARYEHTDQTAKPLDSQPQFASGKRSFDTVSVSGGASYAVAEGWRLGANLSRTERAPAGEELFANGPHGGTEAYELGSPGFKTERSLGAELILRGRGHGYSFEASAYHNWFSNFIYQGQVAQAICEAATPNTVDLPCFQYRQAKARYYGFEVQGQVTLAQFGDYKIAADALADYVHATIRDVGPAPRIPPLRMLGGIGLTSTMFDLRGEVERVTAQNRVAEVETPTEGYTLVNLEVGFRPWGTARPLSLLLSANNLFDVDARRHASFLKDYAPLAGRDIRITARVTF